MEAVWVDRAPDIVADRSAELATSVPDGPFVARPAGYQRPAAVLEADEGLLYASGGGGKTAVPPAANQKG